MCAKMEHIFIIEFGESGKINTEKKVKEKSKV
jgi:hypothetical protein